VKCLEEANQVDNLKYCKYHRLISHHIEKCLVLKDKIMRLHKNRDIIFYDEIAVSNIITMVNLGPRHFSYEFHCVLELNFMYNPCTSSYQLEAWFIWKFDKWWTLVIYRKERKKRMHMTKPIIMRIDGEEGNWWANTAKKWTKVHTN
jgi:hypothetical protein